MDKQAKLHDTWSENPALQSYSQKYSNRSTPVAVDIEHMRHLVPTIASKRGIIEGVEETVNDEPGLIT
jgi:hypothetical protein